jgi:hypothetical protein
MEKNDRISQLLLQIKQQIDELLEGGSADFLTEEEIVILATEIVTSTPFNAIEYSSPMATVDRTKVSFMLDETYEMPIYGEDEDVD